MKPLVTLVTATLLIAGRCTKPPAPKPPSPEPPPTNSPQAAADVFHGDKPYRADPEGHPNIWVVSIPRTSDVNQVNTIRIWVNTTGVAARRAGTSIYCDQIQLVNDNPPFVTIASNEVWRSAMEQATHDDYRATAGSALAVGDVFEPPGLSPDAISSLRNCLLNGRILVRLVNKQPTEPSFHVDSINLETTAK
jgi:hypothetical protein